MQKTRCLTASMLEVGMSFEARLSFTREQVDQYCMLVGDHNAIHRDVEAAKVRFPDTPNIIVPGGLIQTTISALFGTSFPGDGCLGLTFSPERFKRPVCPGEEIDVTLTIARILRGGILDMEIAVTDADGKPLARAQSRVVAPDDAYHGWWLENVDGLDEAGC
ncbi:MAG: MaoC/PaaZ C-terminal domain-containing protein [Thiohalocapsa sp.]